MLWNFNLVASEEQPRTKRENKGARENAKESKRRNTEGDGCEGKSAGSREMVKREGGGEGGGSRGDHNLNCVCVCARARAHRERVRVSV